MSEHQILNEKVREYKELLAKPSWELQAGVSIVCGAPEYISLGDFDPKLIPKTGKNSFDDEKFWSTSLKTYGATAWPLSLIKNAC